MIITMAQKTLLVLITLAVFTVNAKEVHIKIRSEGAKDYNKTPPNGRAYIWIDGKDISPHKQGWNMVVIDYDTGSLFQVEAFNTHASDNENAYMKSFVDAIPPRKIVIMAVQEDAAARMGTAVKECIKKLGYDGLVWINYQTPWVLVGYTGPGTPSWITTGQTIPGFGPINKKLKITLGAAIPIKNVGRGK